MVSKQQLEQRMLQLMEAEQKRASAEDSMQMQVQVLLLKYLKSCLFFFFLLLGANINTVISLKCGFSKGFLLKKE